MDDYEFIDGRCYFRRRSPCYWYAMALDKTPLGDRKMRWPGREPYRGAWHELFPSWKHFWAHAPERTPEVAPPAPLDKFQESMRPGAPIPKIRVR